MSGKHTPLHAVHVAAGAHFTDFAGYDMPVRYSSDLEEHHSVRTAAGIFDLSHMAEIDVSGPQAAQFLDYALSNRLSAMEMLQAKYSLLLSPSGGVVDDLIVYRFGAEHFLIVANASNREVAFSELLARSADFDVEVRDDSDAWALIAVQGPVSREVMMASSITPIHLSRICVTTGSSPVNSRVSPLLLPEPATPAKTATKCLFLLLTPARCGRISKRWGCLWVWCAAALPVGTLCA